MVRNIISYSLRLFLICGIAGVGVSMTFRLVEKKIEANAKAQLNEALKEVSGGQPVEQRKAEEGWLYWKGNEDLYITEGGAQGYSSRLRVLVGMRMTEPEDLEIKAIKVLFQQETPGLGARVEEVESKDTIWSLLGFGGTSDKTEEEMIPWFQAQFRGKKVSAVDKALQGDPAELGRHITGATISSNAVERAILDAVEKIKGIVPKKP